VEPSVLKLDTARFFIFDSLSVEGEERGGRGLFLTP